MKEDTRMNVLQVTSGFRKGVSGGIPSVLFNYCTAPAFEDREIHFDYLSLGYQTFEPYREQLEEKGGTLYNLDIHSTGMKQMFGIIAKLSAFIKRKAYDVVHINSGALTQVLACAIAAKLAGTPRIIVHSHNALVKVKSREILYALLKPLFYMVADDYFACAEIAAKSMFPSGILKKNRWIMIPNAIEIDRFMYDEEIRAQYRKELGLEDKFVIGHVGRFNAQKNHSFLLDVYYDVLKFKSDAVLLLVGTGDLQSKILAKAENLNISDKVIFTGQRRDANNLMQAMDVFVFPSLYEGLGMVLIEAQVSGLRVVTSDKVPYRETKVTDCISYLPLNQKAAWVEEICRPAMEMKRQDRSREIAESSYDIAVAAEKLKKIYLSKL